MTRPPFHLRLISPEEVLFDGPARSLQFPGLDGLVGVLPGHAPLVAAIAPGPLRFTAADGGEKRYFVADGFARVSAEEVSLVCNAAALEGTIDLARAKRAEERARGRIREAKANPEIDLARAQAALARALARQRFVERGS
ncbi:MAG: ATP synthase F1 subunit epsilon [Planctomycetes bacterium]|nr:ATP synthase F1 subunit epsilon [Planctomycetota bacterium]